MRPFHAAGGSVNLSSTTNRTKKVKINPITFACKTTIVKHQNHGIISCIHCCKRGRIIAVDYRVPRFYKTGYLHPCKIIGRFSEIGN